MSFPFIPFILILANWQNLFFDLFLKEKNRVRDGKRCNESSGEDFFLVVVRRYFSALSLFGELL